MTKRQMLILFRNARFVRSLTLIVVLILLGGPGILPSFAAYVDSNSEVSVTSSEIS